MASPAPTPKPVRVGFLAASSIARKTWAAIAAHQSTACVVTAVAARDKAKAQAFIDELQALDAIKFVAGAPVAFGSYDELLSSGLCDAVYISCPMMLRYEPISKALAHGLSVVSEKPIAHDIETTRRFFAEADAAASAARSRRPVFMDGTMLSHGRRIRAVGAALAAAGGVVSVQVQFCFPGGNNMEHDIRTTPLECLGALGDIGHYCLRFPIDALANAGTPVRKISQCDGTILCRASSGVNVTFAGSCVLDDGVFLHFYCSMCEAHQQRISFSCRDGTVIFLDDFCLPFANREATQFFVAKHDISNKTPYSVDHVENTRAVKVEGESSTFQEENMWVNFAEMVRGGDDPATAAMIAQHRAACLLTSEAVCGCYASAMRKQAGDEATK